MKRLLTLLLLVAAATTLRAQGTAPKAMPDSVYYLIPAFTDG